MSFWGYHLMLDCAECNSGISDKDNIIAFTKELVKRIDMTAVGEPVVELLLPGDPNQGYSMMQLITTSNICAHFVDLNSTAYLDIFSCKEYNVEIVKNTVKEFFGAEKMKVNFITRQA